jgi:ubiquinone/menaquinone biosynthesis C-methylase UbiE
MAIMDEEFLKLLLTVHNELPQEGPGSKESTLKALSNLGDLPDNLRILDIGCGPGRQTIDLAQATSGQVIALDLFDQYLDQLKARLIELHLLDRVKTIQGEMEKLPFEKNAFDLIWSEGAIYMMGFKDGLSYWKQFLKPNGYIAVTEVTWLKDDPPPELNRFWQEGYPNMQTIEGNIALIDQCGYSLVDQFRLPKSDWEQYYQPLQKRIDKLKKTGSAKLKEYIKSEEAEIELYNKYSDYYGYVFYLMKIA